MATKKSEVFSHMCFLEEVVYVCLCAFLGGAPFEVWSKYSPFLRKISVLKTFGNLRSKNGPVRACNSTFE